MQWRQQFRHALANRSSDDYNGGAKVETQTVGFIHLKITLNCYIKSANAYGELGGTIEIACESTGIPPPVISWSLPSGTIYKL